MDHHSLLLMNTGYIGSRHADQDCRVISMMKQRGIFLVYKDGPAMLCEYNASVMCGHNKYSCNIIELAISAIFSVKTGSVSSLRSCNIIGGKSKSAKKEDLAEPAVAKLVKTSMAVVVFLLLFAHTNMNEVLAAELKDDTELLMDDTLIKLVDKIELVSSSSFCVSMHFVCFG